ncbi:MAG: hypothetical protein SGPRY_010936, partial [Prymnesium sp.]
MARAARRPFVASPAGSAVLRFRCEVGYDGTGYSGWQTQPHANTLQDLIEARLSSILQHPILVAASGRTDAGVHARAQVFHFECPRDARFPGLIPSERSLPRDSHSFHDVAARAVERAIVGLPENTGLPSAVRVAHVKPASSSFHARESRIGVRYTYTVLEGCGCPFTARFRWAIGKRRLNVDRMAAAASAMVGTHDFSAFAVRNVSDTRTPVKHMRRLEVVRKEGEASIFGAATSHGGDSLVLITAECDRFLQHMMRYISGTLVQVGLGRLSVADIASLLCGEKGNGHAIE